MAIKGEGRGSKDKYSIKQKKKAEHIEASYEEKGVSPKRAETIAWATVNKQSGGGELGGAGKTRSEKQKAAARKDSARRAVDTKRHQTAPDAFEAQTKQDLLAKARLHNIPGRSLMNKQELILALRKPKT